MDFRHPTPGVLLAPVETHTDRPQSAAICSTFASYDHTTLGALCATDATAKCTAHSSASHDQSQIGLFGDMGGASFIGAGGPC